MKAVERIAGALWTLAASAWLFLESPPAPPPAAFVTAVSADRPAGNVLEAPWHREEFITESDSAPMVHAGSMCQRSDGALAAAWYAGSREGAADVAIRFAVRPPGETWNASRPIVTVESARKELGRYVKKLGNPLLFNAPGGRLGLLYVSVSVGGWSGSSLNLKVSDDGGASWSPSERLVLSPFFNLSDLVRNPPARTDDGRIVVPIYHECFGKFPELLWLAPPSDRPGQSGCSYHKTRIAGGRSYIQPALVCLDDDDLLVLLRSCGTAKTAGISRSADAGASWDSIRPSELPNSNSALNAIRLDDGTLLAAFNDSETGRACLRLAASADGGASWRRLAAVENESNPAEFSYPALLQSQDGLIHLLYTWKRKHLKHAAFNRAWLDASTVNESR